MADACENANGGDRSWCWTARVGMLALERTRPDSLVLIQDSSVPAQTLNATDFHFDYELGWDVSLIAQTGSLPEMELRFFSVNSWTAAATAEMITAPIQINAAINAINAAGTVAASYGSDLHNLEANIRFPYSDCVTLLAGFRYLELDERFYADIPGDVTLDVTTRNRLYGAQAGAEASLWRSGRWTLEGVAKLAAFGNAAAQQGVLTTAAPASADRAAEEGVFSFLAEAGLGAVYQVTPRLRIRGAYNILWLGNVALATDQIPVSRFVDDTGIDPHGDAFYHGAYLGVEYRR